MKRFKFLLLFVLLLGTKNTMAAENEPNNSKAQANILALNGSNSGSIGISGDEDWWQVTTNADGRLDVAFTVSNSKTLRCYIYDNDGTTILSSEYSSSGATVSKDGLAAGTYYIKLVAFTTGQLPAYTISNALIQPGQANDPGANNNRGEAINLAQDGTTTGHAGYYYNLYRDTADWYKLTTNADGLLRITLKPGNGETMRIYLYDNDGTTLLNSDYSSSAAIINEDGLAPGTYYVKVFCFYSSDFAPYTLSDSLFLPEQANDAEPDDNREEAKNLPVNKAKTGHAGYYYNLYRDTADWYKFTTDIDGSLRVMLKPGNGETMRIYLYDNDGTTLLNSDYSSSAATINQDGLAPGTYYVKVFCFYSSDFAPYTLSDSFFTYNYTADKEPNKYASQAKTMPANSSITGHAGFYYNHVRDTVDWWRINYTGAGDVSFTINQETLFEGGTNTLRFQVYKDTAASPIHSSYSAVTARVVNLSSLSRGYYWIKVYPFYSSQFSSYSISNTFTQVNTATIHVASYDTAGNCTSVNSITFKTANSKPPYTIQLYRFGAPYGGPVNTRQPYTFTNLPTGSYYATVYGDGATGAAFGTSKVISIEPIPSGLNATEIQSTKAKLNWTAIECASYFVIQYKVHGANTWSKKNTTGNVNNYVLKGLAPGTQYDWRIATADSANDLIAMSVYADTASFTTPASFAADGGAEEKLRVNASKNIAEISVSPNPATNYFIIRYTGAVQQQVEATLYNAGGKAVWRSGILSANALNNMQVMVTQFAGGLYYLKIVDSDGYPMRNIKVSITK